jgi:hypothetical protein
MEEYLVTWLGMEGCSRYEAEFSSLDEARQHAEFLYEDGCQCIAISDVNGNEYGLYRLSTDENGLISVSRSDKIPF